MSQINIPSTQLAQLGFADRIAYENHGQAEIARQTAQLITPEALKQQRDMVSDSEKSEKNRALKSEEDGRGGQGTFGDQRRQQKGSSTGESEESSPSPWSGNILNVKV